MEEKLELEVASIYYFVDSLLHIKPYFSEIPEGMVFPCVFYPPPGAETKPYSSSSYATSFSLYAKIMAATNLSASSMVAAVVEAIGTNHNKVPLVQEDGSLTGKNFRIRTIKTQKADEGVYQLALTWMRYTKFTTKDVTKAQEFFVNGRPLY
jgi:hypothetical protein